MRNWIAAIVVLKSLSACALLDRDLTLETFHQGMTRTELTAANGLPGNIHANRNREVWQYCHAGLLNLRRTTLVNVLLVNGRVAGFDFHPDSAPRHCKDLYRAFSWETAAYQPSYK